MPNTVTSKALQAHWLKYPGISAYVKVQTPGESDEEEAVALPITKKAAMALIGGHACTVEVEEGDEPTFTVTSAHAEDS